LSNLNPSSPPPLPLLPNPDPSPFSRHEALIDLLAARRGARQAHKAYWQATFPGNGRWVGPNTNWVYVADDSELSMRCTAADSEVASAEVKLKQVSNLDPDPSLHASMYDTSQIRTCEQSGEDDENSAESSVEEWEATAGGGFVTRVQPSGRATSPPGEWYVYGFEPDGCGGSREIRRWRSTYDPLEAYVRPRALRPSQGPKWTPPPSGGGRLGPGGIPAGPLIHPLPGARPIWASWVNGRPTDIRPTVTTTRVPELVQVATRYSLLRGFPRSREASWVPTYTCYLSIGCDTHEFKSHSVTGQRTPCEKNIFKRHNEYAAKVPNPPDCVFTPWRSSGPLV
jgi:hypothetical protein